MPKRQRPGEANDDSVVSKRTKKNSLSGKDSLLAKFLSLFESDVSAGNIALGHIVRVVR